MQNKILKIWSEKKLAYYLLCPLSKIYGLIWQIYKHFPRKIFHAPVPVIIVGNITVGGTGKTPMVIAVSEYLLSIGLKPGIITRGYGGKLTKNPIIVDEYSDPKNVGDEPVLIATRTKMPVVACRDRVCAIQYLLKNFSCNVVVSDDGLQHLRLGRNFEIVMVSKTFGLGNGALLPAGPLREPATKLLKVDMVIDNLSPKIISIRSLARKDLSFENIEHFLDHIKNQKISAMAGIAHPDNFFNLLKGQGIVLSNTYPFLDHASFTPEDVAGMSGVLLMTEKDAVKCAQLFEGMDIDPWVVAIRVECPDVLKKKLQQSVLIPSPPTLFVGGEG